MGGKGSGAKPGTTPGPGRPKGKIEKKMKSFYLDTRIIEALGKDASKKVNDILSKELNID